MNSGNYSSSQSRGLTLTACTVMDGGMLCRRKLDVGMACWTCWAGAAAPARCEAGGGQQQEQAEICHLNSRHVP